MQITSNHITCAKDGGVITRPHINFKNFPKKASLVKLAEKQDVKNVWRDQTDIGADGRVFQFSPLH